MYIHISIRKVRNMRTEIGQIMPVATAIMRISAFIAMRLLRGQGLITGHPVPVMMVRDNHRKQCQDAGHQHHVLYNPMFHFLTHGTKIRIFFRFLHACCKFALNRITIVCSFTAEFFYFRILYGIIHGVDHSGILILETRENHWELRIEN